MNERIFRWETPGHYDMLPYGTEIVRLRSSVHTTAEIFKQVSRDQDNPQWESLGVVDGSTATSSPIGDMVGEL